LQACCISSVYSLSYCFLNCLPFAVRLGRPFAKLALGAAAAFDTFRFLLQSHYSVSIAQPPGYSLLATIRDAVDTSDSIRQETTL
jgi:hypothetical protein